MRLSLSCAVIAVIVTNHSTGAVAGGADVSMPLVVSSSEWPARVLMTGTGDGRIMTMDSTGVAAVWDDQGNRLETMTIDGVAQTRGDSATLFHVAGERAILCETETAPPLACTLIDLPRRRVVAHFSDETYPADVAAVDGGWVVIRRRSLQGASVRRYDNAGRFVGDLALPQPMIEEASRQGGGPQAACPRIFSPGTEIWAVPSGLYEFFRISPALQQSIPVPPCLRVAGNTVPSDLALKRVDQLYQCLGSPNPFVAFTDTMRAAMEARQKELGLTALPQKTPANTSPPSWLAAVRSVAVDGNRVAILVEPRPDGPEAGCRIDLWRFPGPSWSASQAIGAPCPRLVGLTRSGVWLRCGTHVTQLKLAGHASSSDPCQRPHASMRPALPIGGEAVQ